MKHLRGFMEEGEIVEEKAEGSPDEVHKSVLSDPTPTRDVSIQGRGKSRGNEAPTRVKWGPISASLGAMRPLVAKLDKLLLDPPQGCCSEGVKVGMHLLKDDVKKLSSFLDELSEVEDPPVTAKCWMEQARDLSYEMDDYMDSLLFVEPGDHSLVANDPIAPMLYQFSKYVQEAIERHKVYVLPDSSPGSALRCRFVSFGPMLPTPYAEIVMDDQMDEFMKFMDSLANDGDKQLKVVSVFGSTCLGKTTLARVLYDRIETQFDCRAFIQVSKKPVMKRIFRDMLSQLQRLDPPEYRNETDLIDIIKKSLQNKRYLIIIDDVWTAAVWDIINHALPKGNHSSIIIATTQIEDVAFRCCRYQSEHVFEMKPLDDNHSRKLFFNRLFGSESDCPEQFKEILSRIVEICGGLPLATIVIASLLASQPNMTEALLKHIHESLSSLFSACSTSERTRQALNLSFNSLPLYLKTCLMYLSTYSEGYTFCTDVLVKQWMAEGFIDTTEGQDMEKVAESYLYQLIARRFIQPIWINENNELLSCVVHEAVHDLIAHTSAEDNFIVAISYSQNNVALSRKARRLSLLFGDASYAKTPANFPKSQVRSLTYFGILECMPCITEYNLLRVLDLQVSDHGGEDNPVDLTGISELLQLRYLKIGCGICIKLPTDGLQCLETLDITDAIVINISWRVLPPDLLHLSLAFDASLLYWIGRLNCLEDLHLTCSPANSYDLDENTEALESLIEGHGNLRTVVVTHGSMVKNNVVRRATKVITSTSKEVISSGAPHLQRLECAPASGMVFPRIRNWVRKLGNLCTLMITMSRLQMDSVGILKGLRALTTLSLYVRWTSTEKIIFDKAGFLALKYFKLRFTNGIAWVKFEEGAMPNLFKLKLVFNSIPRMDVHHYFFSTHTGGYKQYKRGTPLISIEHMPGLREISAKFGGAAADVEYIKSKRIGISNDRNNPDINMKWVDHQSTKQKEQEFLEENPADETLDGAAAERSPESLHEFTLDELMSATTNFSEAHFHDDNFKKSNLDKTFCRPGVYAGSFKGNLRTGLAPQNVAVKCVNKFSDDREWLLIDETELECLAMVRHPHLVRLLGFCDYYDHRMLVYGDMPRKTLKYYKHSEYLERSTRLKIAIGAAKGLAFLHEADQPMVHGDFKTSRILIDHSGHIAKLCGFRLANENPLDKTPGTSTLVDDVYNFGVVLLELLPERLSVDEKRQDLNGNLEDLLPPYLLSEDRAHHIMDSSMKGKYSASAAASSAVNIARWCMKSVPEERPSMRDVVEALELLLELVNEDESAYNQAGDRGWSTGRAMPHSTKWVSQHAFTFDELMSATSNFSEENLLGKNKNGTVYKGILSRKIMVAVTKLTKGYWPSYELQYLGRKRHPHFVTLLGHCEHDGDTIFLHEYMPRGSLKYHLLETNLIASLPWLTRLKIAVGAAKALDFIHGLGGLRMYHRTGFTASNILLALDYSAKLWGILHEESAITFDTAPGGDVYNFGVVLLELLAGRPSVDEKRRGTERNLVEWSRPYLISEDTLHHIMDPGLEGQYSSSAAWSTLTTARWCLERKPNDVANPIRARAYMCDVVDALEPLLSDDRNDGPFMASGRER